MTYCWEQGNRCWGLWVGTPRHRVAFIEVGAKGKWIRGNDLYLWNTDEFPEEKGSEMTLSKAKRAVESVLELKHDQITNV